MARSGWHKLYQARIGAQAGLLFGLLSDLPNYPAWLPASQSYRSTTDVQPYPVRLGSRYRDGKPGDAGQDWWGTVTGFQPPGSIDFHHTIRVRQLRTTIDVHIHYSLEADGEATEVSRWLLLDFAMPVVFRPLRPLVTARFDRENVRTIAALREYAEAQPTSA